MGQPIPAAINGAGDYMSNWDAQLDRGRQTGTLSTMFPADLKLPMVAPADLGRAAADRLMSSVDDVGTWSIEGPECYSSQDVADAFARVLGRHVQLDVTPPGQLEQAFVKLGFSDASAQSYARMTRAAIKQKGETPHRVWRGKVTLDAYIDALAAAKVREPQHV